MGIVPLPLTRLGSPTRFPPRVICREPVGTGFPLPPFTVAVTVTACAVVMLEEESVTDTVGVTLLEEPTETVIVPFTLL